MEHSGFPSDETLAAFIDGGLDAETRQRVLEHLTACDECYNTFLATSAFRDRENRPEPVPLRRPAAGRGWWVAAASLTMVAVLAFVGLALLRREPAVNELQRPLVDAVNSLEYRTVEARLSLPVSHKPYEPVYRAEDGDPGSKDDDWTLYTAGDKVRQEAARNPTVENLHRLGLAHLLVRKHDQAIAHLEQAMTKSAGEPDPRKAVTKTRNVDLLIDLAAAYHARAAGDDHLAAFGAIERAWQLDKQRSRPEIAYNRALAFQALSLFEEAERSWQLYLSLDPASEWSAEATKEREKVAVRTDVEKWPEARDTAERLALDGRVDLEDTARQFPKQVREHIEDELLPRWARASREGDGDTAANAITIARALALSLRNVNGESLPLDAVRAIEQASAEEREALAAGHIAFAEGRAREKSPETAPFFERARDSFRRTKSPFVYWAEFERSSCAAFDGNDYAAARAAMHSLEHAVQRHSGYRALRAKIRWIDGLSLMLTDPSDKAVDLMRESLRIFEALREAGNAAAVHSLLAEFYGYLGDHPKASQHSNEAFRLVAQTGERWRRRMIFNERAMAALQRQQYAAAEAMFNRVANEDKEPADACTTLMYRGLVRAHLGNDDLSEEDLRNAAASCARIGSADVRERQESQLAFVRAMASRIRRSDGGGTRELDEAIAFLERRRSNVWLSHLYHERGVAALKRRDLRAAESDLRLAITRMESARGEVGDVQLRETFFAGSRDAFTALMGLLVEQRRMAEALDVAERARSRALLEVFSERAGLRVAAMPLRAGDVQRRLPAAAALVHYFVLPDRVVAWIVESGESKWAEMRVPSTHVEAAAARYAAASTASQEEAAAAELFDMLVRPWWTGTGASHLVVVPAPEFAEVPIAALLERQTRTRVIERFSVSAAPSATVFAAATAVYPQRPAMSGRVLVAAAPRAGVRGQLRTLEAAEREAQQVAALYPGSEIFEEKDDFLAAARNAAVIHYAGHARADRSDPGKSALSFESGRADEVDWLTMRELPPAAFRQTRLVVLAGCETAVTGKAGLEGSASIVRSFMAAGVPAVIGTLWPVKDEVAAEFSVNFHERLARGLSPAAAIRDTQVSLLKNSKADVAGARSWAAFQLFGAGI